MLLIDSAANAALLGALIGVGGTITGGVLGLLGALSVEWRRRRATDRAELRNAIGAFLAALTEHSMALVTGVDDETRSTLEYRANTAATVVTMHLSRSEDDVADIVLGAVVNVSPPEKQFDRADVVRSTLRAWYRREVPTRGVKQHFDELLANTATALMP